jgi:hypothetical protein
VCPLRGRRLRFLPLPLDLRLFGHHLRFARHEMLRGCGERGGEIRVGGFSLGGWRRRVALIRDFGGSWQNAD